MPHRDEAEQRQKLRAIALARWEGEGGALTHPTEQSVHLEIFDPRGVAATATTGVSETSCQAKLGSSPAPAPLMKKI